MAQITLTNEFHGTATKIRIKAGDTLSERRLRDIKRNLCDYSGCQCSGRDGARGHQHGLYCENLVLVDQIDGMTVEARDNEIGQYFAGQPEGD